MSEDSPYRVMLVDDQMLIREGLASLLALSERVHVVAQATDGIHALELLDQMPNLPDVVLLDLRMPKLDGIGFLRALQARSMILPVIVLTTFDDHSLLLDALQAGAKGYLLKDVSLETLIQGIDHVCRGESLIQPAMTARLLAQVQGRQLPFEAFAVPEALTEKEVEVLRLVAAGCSNKEIAHALSKSEGTVKNQISTIIGKLGVRDRTRAVLKALEQGWL